MNINDNNNNKNIFSNFEYKLAKFKLKNIKKFNNNFDLLNTTLIQDLSTKNKTDIKNSNNVENCNLSSNKNNFFDINVSNSIENNNNIKKKYNNNNENSKKNIKNDENNKKIEKKIIKSKSSIFEKKIKEIKFNILQKTKEISKKNIFNLKKVPLLNNKFRNTTNLNNFQNEKTLFKRDYFFHQNLNNLNNLNNFIQTINNSFEKTTYNLNKSLTPRKKNQIPEIFQCFNSSSAKNLFYENKKNFNKIGPGYYNITKYKSILPQKEKKIYFNKKNNDNNNNNNILPGPGYYNISKNFIKKSFSNENIFSHEIRFKKNIQISPGPGEYNINNNINNNNNNKNKYKPFFRKINNNNINNKENIIKRNLFNNNNNNYINYSFSTIDNSHTIQFNILKKLFNKNYKNAPFGSGDFKKYYYINKTNNNLGGFYQNDLFKTIVEKNNFFFKNNENNKINNNNKLRFVVPHSYYKDSYFNWNKKSFNINYNEI